MMQKIQVLAELIDRISGRAKGIGRSMSQMAARSRFLGKVSRQTGIEQYQLSRAMKHLGWNVNTTGRLFERSTGRFVAMDNAMKELTSNSKKFQRRFQFHYLSILFFGMAIQRVFMQMATESTKAFLKMTEGQTQAGEALNGLSAGFEFLKFSVGDALGTALIPVLPTILGIIEGISDWISRNRNLTATLITAGLAVGTLMMWMAILKLGLSGINTLLITQSSAIGGWSASMGALGGPIGIAIALLAALAVALALAQWEDVKEAAKEFANFLEEDFKGATKAANKHLDNALDLMGLAIEEFFTIKVPHLFWSGVKATLAIIPRAVESLMYAWYRAWRIPDAQARSMAKLYSGSDILVGIAKSISVPSFEEEIKDIEKRRRAIMDRMNKKPSNVTMDYGAIVTGQQGMSVASSAGMSIAPVKGTQNIDSVVKIENLNITGGVSEEEATSLTSDAIERALNESTKLKSRVISVIEDEFGIDIRRYTNTTV